MSTAFTTAATHPSSITDLSPSTDTISAPDAVLLAAPDALHPAAPHWGDEAEPTTTHLHPARLLPRLHLTAGQQRPGLSDDGFSDSPAMIALSRQLSAGLHCLPETGSSGRRAGNADPLITVSQRGLGELDLFPQQAWDVAAENLLHRSREAEGFRFYTRPASVLSGQPLPALQVATPGSSPTDWLAHPHTFSIMHFHLRRLMRTEVRYVAPTREVLLAFPARAPELESFGKFLEEHVLDLGRPLLGGRAISYECGFPALSGATH